LEHRELMAQDEDFDVLGSVAADSQRHLHYSFANIWSISFGVICGSCRAGLGCEAAGQRL